MGLSAFLKQNAIREVEEVEVIVSDRFKEDGKVIPFVLQPITAGKDDELKKQCQIQTTGKGGRVKLDFDTTKYMRLMTIETLKTPNLHSQELQDSYGVMGAEELLKVFLKSGEYSELLKAVQKVNGFKTFDELEEEAKN